MAASPIKYEPYEEVLEKALTFFDKNISLITLKDVGKKVTSFKQLVEKPQREQLENSIRQYLQERIKTIFTSDH